MYSGTTLTKYSGRVIGTHQKIDRLARRQLAKLIIDDTIFPNIRNILQFEGRNGPDGIKIKSPAKDEPWHYYNPFDDSDNKLMLLIDDHYTSLVTELASGNRERSAFEAAWLAHALVDGLTPAHHYPYEAKLLELMGGKGLDTRTSVIKKNVVGGETRREFIKNNWEMWGPKGLRTGHGLFELGIATLIAPLTFAESQPTKTDINRLRDLGITSYYQQVAREVAVLGMFDAYLAKGWTPKLVWQVRHRLGPALVSTVTLIWHNALVDAGLTKI